MHKYIKEAIAETTTTLTSPETAPFATTKQMYKLLADFKIDIQKCWINLLSMQSTRLSPMGPPYGYGLDPALNYQMQTPHQHPGHHSPPVLHSPSFKRTREGTPDNVTHPASDNEFFDASMQDAKSDSPAKAIIPPGQT
jgi:hypothetical protein